MSAEKAASRNAPCRCGSMCTDQGDNSWCSVSGACAGLPGVRSSLVYGPYRYCDPKRYLQNEYAEMARRAARLAATATTTETERGELLRLVAAFEEEERAINADVGRFQASSDREIADRRAQENFARFQKLSADLGRIEGRRRLATTIAAAPSPAAGGHFGTAAR